MVNHGGLPYARTTNGTLTVTEDTRGLRFAATLANVTDARDLTVLLERGDVSQMSFAFRVAPDGVEWDVDDDKRERRTITEFLEFDEISAVTFPAYPDTTVSATGATADEPGDRSQRQDPDEQAHAGGDLQGGRRGDACPGSDSTDDEGVTSGVRARVAAARRRLTLLDLE
jgi:HK97 family phage prohead protease